MKTDWRNAHSSLKVVTNPELPAHMDRVREVIAVFTEPAQRNQGHATALIEECCAEADNHAIVLLLKPEKFGKTGGHKNLKKFYERFGFVKIQDNPVLMARAPTFNPRKKDMVEVVETVLGR